MGGRQPYIILIDDDTSRSTALAYALLVHGYQVTCARKNGSAMALITVTVPDLVIIELDLWHRAMGWSIVQWLRTSPSTTHIPLVATTDMRLIPSELATDLAAMHLPVLQRPWSLEQLVLVIQGLLTDGRG